MRQGKRAQVRSATESGIAVPRAAAVRCGVPLSPPHH